MFNALSLEQRNALVDPKGLNNKLPPKDINQTTETPQTVTKVEPEVVNAPEPENDAVSATSHCILRIT